mgnify:CR=1 FL=1
MCEHHLIRATLIPEVVRLISSQFNISDSVKLNSVKLNSSNAKLGDKVRLTLDYSEGDELRYYETEEVMVEEDRSEGTYFTRYEVIEHVTDEIIKLETVENYYILLSEDSDYQLNNTETVEVGYYRSDGVEMIINNESGEFITLKEYLNN